MKNLKSFDQWIAESVPFYIGSHQVDSPADTVLNVLGEEESEYMFFNNLKVIKKAVDNMLKMDPAKVDAILKNGHAWAVDHIATSKDDIEEVHGFLMGQDELQVSEGKTTDFHRILAMTPTWWEAWKIENQDKGFDIKTDAFSKTHEVSKDGKTLFIFDYGRNKIFTNEDPQTFILNNDMTPEELEKLKDKAEKNTVPGSTDSNEPDDQGVEDDETADADTKNSDTEEE